MCADRPSTDETGSDSPLGRARRIGILGGTFDPVHLGHVASAREIAAAHRLERVLFVLSARPPHKSSDEAAPVEDRWRMLMLATTAANVEGAVPLDPCDIEIRRGGLSWTVDTLRELASEHPRAELVLILGADAYAEIDTWSRPGELLELASIVVTSRPGWIGEPVRNARAAAADAHDFEQAPLPPVAARENARYDPTIGGYVHTSGHTLIGQRIRGIEVSSTEIRQRARAGLPIQHLTGDTVARYIEEHRLYGFGCAPAPAGAATIQSRGTGKD